MESVRARPLPGPSAAGVLPAAECSLTKVLSLCLVPNLTPATEPVCPLSRPFAVGAWGRGAGCGVLGAGPPGASGPWRHPGRGPGTGVAPATNWPGTYVPAPGDRRRPGWHELAPGAGDRKRIA